MSSRKKIKVKGQKKSNKQKKAVIVACDTFVKSPSAFARVKNSKKPVALDYYSSDYM